MRMVLIKMEVREGMTVELLMLEWKVRWGLAWKSSPKAMISRTSQQPLALSREVPAVSPHCYEPLESHFLQNAFWDFRLPVSLRSLWTRFGA